MCFFQIVTLQDCTVDWLIRALFEAMETTLSLLTVSHRRVVHFLPPGFVPGVTQQEISQFLTSAVLSPLLLQGGCGATEKVWFALQSEKSIAQNYLTETFAGQAFSIDQRTNPMAGECPVSSQ